ncbi:MAG: VWA domain-containing protein [Deltaproteobacteria bacterium]|nr:VWA domain-containing protein [Deltaproteobacteria bacterium]
MTRWDQNMKNLSILLSLCCLAVALAGCGEGLPGAPGGEDGLPIDGESDSCLVPSAGCPCDGEAPRECYVEHGSAGGDVMCGAGTRYCRGGTWSACEDLEDFTIARSSAAITGPVACSLCDPLCNVSTDRPDDGDLSTDNSDGVIYDPIGGGISIPPSPFETPELVDTDGDGVADVADDCPTTPGSPDFFGCTTGRDGIYFELPFNGPAELEPCELSVGLNSVDVYFLVDTTGSMGGELYNLQRGLTSGTYIAGCPGGIIGAMDCTIPDIQFGVGQAEDYPRSPFGVYYDDPYVHRQDITASAAAAQAAVNALNLGNGYDWPESQGSALWAVATGNGLGGYTPARSGCPAGTWGYPCFREEAIPVIVLITDAPFHNGNRFPYSGLGFTAPSWANTISALRAAGIRVIIIESANWYYYSDRRACLDDYEEVATQTGAVDGAGDPFVYNINSNGTGLDGAVVSAIDDLANATRLDIVARAIDNPATAFDERQLVSSVTAATYSPGGACGGRSGNRFTACVPGSDVRFEIVFHNDVVMPTAVPQVFNFWIRAYYDGTSLAAEKPVRIVVPPENPCIVAATTGMPCPRDFGSYWRVHDAADGCSVPPESPVWGEFDWTATTPSDSYIEFSFQTAATEAGLSGATPVRVTVPPTTPTVDVGALLNGAGISPSLRYLQVTATLASSLDHEDEPVLQEMRLDYTCTTTE